MAMIGDRARRRFKAPGARKGRSRLRALPALRAIRTRRGPRSEASGPLPFVWDHFVNRPVPQRPCELRLESGHRKS